MGRKKLIFVWLYPAAVGAMFIPGTIFSRFLAPSEKEGISLIYLLFLLSQVVLLSLPADAGFLLTVNNAGRFSACLGHFHLRKR